MRVWWLSLACVLACRHGCKDSADGAPSSCLIEHDGGVTQCFDEIGESAKKDGPAYCGRMYGQHTFRVGIACPTEGVVASCTKKAGTEIERVERCYRDVAACEARCTKSGGTFNP
jgi:hypothetical protein